MSRELVGQELPISPQQDSHLAKRAKKGIKLEIHALKVSANAVDSLNHGSTSKSKSFGSNHQPKITDASVDNAGTRDNSSPLSPFRTQTAEDMGLPAISQIHVPNTPGFQSQGCVSAKLG
jgi:hypothetical protein